MSYLWVTLLGRPGAGKTKVGKALASSNSAGVGDIHYVSGSSLLEKYVTDRRPGWQKVESDKNEGRTANPELTHTLLAEVVEELAGEGVVLLDGFPKSLKEIATTEAVLPGGVIDLAIFLDCPMDECLARIEDRLVCPECGFVTTARAGSAADSSCEVEGCGGSLARREDDACAERVKVQGDESAVVLVNHFHKLDRLFRVDALAGEQIVVGEVMAILRTERTGPFSQNRG